MSHSVNNAPPDVNMTLDGSWVVLFGSNFALLHLSSKLGELRFNFQLSEIWERQPTRGCSVRRAKAVHLGAMPHSPSYYVAKVN